jgi:hypothetical protein
VCECFPIAFFCINKRYRKKPSVDEKYIGLFLPNFR